MNERADVVVIGMGPGGEDLAGRLAQAGLDVVGVERQLLGGECPYWGCVPSKMAVRAGNLLADDRVAVERFEGKGGRFIRAEGRIVAPGRVVAGAQEIEAERAVVVATGTRPVIPPIPGLSDALYWTNREALEAKELPSSVVILGGGAVGVELGQTFARFGVRTTIVEALDRLLPTEEAEAGELLGEVLRDEGVDVRVGTPAERVARDGHRHAVTLRGGDVVTGTQIVVATGRRADPAAVGLDAVGVPADARVVPIDEHLRVAPGVWAVGDVTGKGPFTHVAMYQARIAAADILGQAHEPADYRAVPRVTFADPEVGSVGLTEADAREAGIEVRVGQAALPASARGWIHKAGNHGLVKVVTDAEREVLVGATSVGPAGGEVLGLLVLSVHARIPVAQLRQMIYAYPTFHRAVEDALRDLA